jgi:hypothetical protein
MYNILKQLITQLLPSEGLDGLEQRGLSFQSYLQEYRTLNLSVPRRSGKTRALCALSKEYSSLYITSNVIMADWLRKDGVEANTIEGAIRSFLGYRNPNKGLRYNCILLDEEVLQKLPRLLDTLLHANLINSNVFIVRVGTDVK